MKLVINASPLIFLSKIDSLPLLGECFQTVLAPPTVLLETGLELPGIIQSEPLTEVGNAFVRGALGPLHKGELEVIVLAQEKGITLVGMDDLLARRKARQLGLQPIGTVGILLLAHHRRLIDTDEVSRKLHALVNRHGMYLSARILTQVLDSLR